MGFNRPEAKRLAKAAMRNTNPNPMLVTLVFVLLTTGVSYLVGLVLTNPIYDALYTAICTCWTGPTTRCSSSRVCCRPVWWQCICWFRCCSMYTSG